MPVGGIGTGTIGLGGRGDLRDFELGNRPAKGFRPRTCFAALRVGFESGEAFTKLLEGPLEDWEFEGQVGSPAANHGLPRFRDCTFETTYPLGRALLTDDTVPVRVAVEAFNPLVPGDVAVSSIPAMVLRYVVTNLSAASADVSVCLTMENFVGSNGTNDHTGGNVNRTVRASAVSGISMSAPGLDQRDEAGGEFCLSVLGGGADDDVTTRTGWADRTWGDSLLEFWDDFSEDGTIGERTSSAKRPIASLCRKISVSSGETGTITFILTWNFPNRRAWASMDMDTGIIGEADYTDDIVGNYYSSVYPDAWKTALDVSDRLTELERRTVRAVAAFASSDLPSAIREAALFNISTLRSPTVFQTSDGRFYGWEGVSDRRGSCFGNCTHVWGYEFATSYWFSEIAWSFRDTQFAKSVDERGLMGFRVGLPLGEGKSWELGAADGQMASIVHLYQDWRLSGDTDRLKALWPHAKRAMEFSWIPGGWDADQDGVMEGAQHNTMDVEYYGPNPQMAGWYLAALRSCERIGRALGDAEFADHCERLFQRGSAWIDAHLFTGEYYRHEIRPARTADNIAPGLLRHPLKEGELEEPIHQLGDGCLIDQMVGQYAAHLCGLGHLLNPANVRTALRSVFEHNFKRGFFDHFNHMRTYVLDDEAALLMCNYPAGTRPEHPFPYYNEVMTGFEYTAAVGLIQEGEREFAMEVIKATRNRYDGRRRNPFDEAEAGRHYARAMASWSAAVAWSGFDYDAVTGTLLINRPRADSSFFWSTGSAFGTVADVSGEVTLCVVEGSLRLARVELPGMDMPAFSGQIQSIRAGKKVILRLG